MATLASQHPSTPPDVENHELQDGFHQLLQHNARIPHQPNQYTMDHGSYIPSSSTPYTTPEPELAGQWYMDQYGNQCFMYPDRVGRGGDIQYDGYGQTVYRGHQNSIYQGHPLPQQQLQYPPPALYSTTTPPPTSDQSTPPRRTTRQRGLAASTESRHSSPKSKRKAGKGNPKPKTLAGPLSELTKDMTHIPVKDTETWVNRSTEVRRAEAKKDNFVKRPSNSFILYRSAYADRARSFQKSANHQIVSSIAGESWTMEPTDIRKQYDTWAKLERENHAKAFPEYKFQPQTNKAASRKRKGREEDSEDESGLSDYDYGSKGGGRAIRSKKSRSTYRDSSNTPSTLDDYNPYAQDPNMYHHSSYQTNNPGKPLPAALDQLGGAQYYQTTSHPNQRMAQYGHIEDVFVRPTDAPTGYHYNEAPPVIGFPGAYHHELQGGDDGQSLSHLDPMLASYDQTNPRLSLSAGHTSQQIDSTPQSGSYQVGFQSPLLNDFESEDGDEPPMGSDAWWAKHAD